MKKILLSLLGVILVISLVGLGVFAYFSDTETSTPNSFKTGKLDISLGASTYSAGIKNMQPGDTETITFYVYSNGTLPLKYTVGPVVITGSVTGGSHDPYVSSIWIDGVKTASGSLSAAGGGDPHDKIQVNITLPSAAGNNYQDKTGNVSITINATQQ